MLLQTSALYCQLQTCENTLIWIVIVKQQQDILMKVSYFILQDGTLVQDGFLLGDAIYFYTLYLKNNPCWQKGKWKI